MKKIVKILSFAMAICLVVSSFALFVIADNHTQSLEANWNFISAKYSSKTDKIIAPKNVIKTEGFSYTVNSNDGIDVSIPNQTTFAGVRPVAAISSKNTTKLDNLNVEFTFNKDKAAFHVDKDSGYANINVMWTSTDKTAAVEDLTKGNMLDWGGNCLSNGLRHLALIGSTKSTDSFGSEITNFTTDKGVCVSVMNNNPNNEGTLIASTVYVDIFDGTFCDRLDSHPGFRWTFTARNDPEKIGTAGDQSDIAQSFLKIDLNDGLYVQFRKDSTLGYVVVVNGVDYYSHEKIAYYPNTVSGTGFGGGFSPEDYGYHVDETTYEATPTGNGPTINELSTMEYAKQDINFKSIDYKVAKKVSNWNAETNDNYEYVDAHSNGITGTTAGYLTIGVCGNSNEDPKFDFTIESINGQKAGLWTGGNADSHTHNWDHQCTKTFCTICGAHYNDPTLSHTWGDPIDGTLENCEIQQVPDFTATPTKSSSVDDEVVIDENCEYVSIVTDEATGEKTVTFIAEPTDLDANVKFAGWVTTAGSKAPTYRTGDVVEDSSVTKVYPVYETYPMVDAVVCTSCANGTYDHECVACGTKETVTVASTIPHTFGEWEIVTAATESTDGSQKRVCSVCGFEDVQVIPATGGGNGGNDTTTVTSTAPATTTKASATTTKAGATTTKAGAASTTKASGGTTAAAKTGSATQTTAAQTFDAGIACAVGAVICSGIGLVSTKKKKK